MTPLWSDRTRVAAPVIATSIGLLGVVAGAQSWAGAPSAPAAPVASPANTVAPRDCAGCHAEVTREWQASLHAQSFRDPIFRAEFLPHPAEDCVACHAPLATDLVAPTAADTDEGVSCVSCHVDGAGHILASTTLRHGRGAGAEREAPPHPVRRGDDLRSAAQCARCHEFPFPPARAGSMGYDPAILQQSTFTEWRRSRAGRQALTCVGCHMPQLANGHFDHRMPGASAELLARAVQVQARAIRAPDGVSVQITLRTRAVGHALPTGDIFRRLIVRAEHGHQSASEELRRYFGASHVGGSLVTTVIDDTRIMPGRPRTVTLRLPHVSGESLVRWSVAHARLDLDVARARGLPLSDVLTVFESGETRVR